MSLSPAPVLDFFFDCGPPPKKPDETRSRNPTQQYNILDNHSHLMTPHQQQNGRKSVDFFDVQFSNQEKIRSASPAAAANLNLYSSSPSSNQIPYSSSPSNQSMYSSSPSYRNTYSPSPLSHHTREHLPPSNQIVEHLEEFKYTGLTLNSPWTLWINRFVSNLSKEEFESNLRKIYTISTVKTFWNVFNHMPSPNHIKPQYSYHLMRNNIRPVWEDPSHTFGGMWKLRCPKKYTDTVWQELLLACVGEQFLDDINPDDEILGLSVSIRKNDDLIQVWNLNSEMAADSNVVRKIKELCPDVQFETSFYKPHHTYWQANKTTWDDNTQKKLFLLSLSNYC